MSEWYQLENAKFNIQVTSTGAEIKRFFSKTLYKELLWLPVDDRAKGTWHRSAPVLFPIAGKLKNDQFHFQGKNYQLPQHGFARDMEFKCVESSNHEIQFMLETTQETFDHFPFCFELYVTYLLDDNKVKTTYSVKNVDRQDIYFSIGAHPGFATNDLSDCEIRFEKAEKGFYQLKDKLVDWNQLHPLSSNILRPTKELFAHDALIFKDLKSSYVDLVRVHHNEIIRVHRGHSPYFVLWGKAEVPFICLEPWWGISDDVFHDGNLESKKGIVKLAMGASQNFSYTIELI